MQDLGVRVARARPALEVFRDDAQALHAYAVFLANTHLTTRYLHWDEVRRLQPPGDLTPEEWWHAIKLGRAPQLRPLRFSDAERLPFLYTVPEEAVRLLHLLDRRCSAEPEQGQAARRYLVDALFEEAIRTSQLAGSSLPQDDAKSLLRTAREPSSPDEHAVV